ncbi:hypothetical protein FA13DRAFT_1787747 [Coprinellus micaceus]|uniref:Uncharacterized protein n=1 Tax=Coprinellus micaceus TaxID=71717 RepID=A0A4Y7TQR8_COPMI|nr:hypothetical protein FA13DRAFT_1787747 [Coprinellus micaceus]
MNQKKRFEEELTKSKRRSSDREREADIKNAQVLALKRGNKDLQHQLLGLNHTNQSLRSQLEGMEAEIREMEIELIQPLMSVFEEMQQQLVTLQQDNIDIGSKLEAAKTPLHSRELDIEGLRARERGFYNQIEEMAALEATLRAVEAEGRLKDARIEHLSKAQERLLTTERDQWQREVMQLNNKLSECYRRLKSGQSDPTIYTDFQTSSEELTESHGFSSYRSPPSYSGPGRMET